MRSAYARVRPRQPSCCPSRAERAVPPSFEITVSPDAGGLTVAVAGELDLATADEFEATLLERLAAGPVRLDLWGLSFMDSTGIRVLDALLRDLPMIGSTLLIDPSLQPAVRQIITLTGMIGALPFDAPPAATVGERAARATTSTSTATPTARPMMFAHGFGCDQNMWRYVWPAFEDDFRIVLFDHVGAGGSDAAAYRPRPLRLAARLRRRRRSRSAASSTCATSSSSAIP